MEKIRMADLLPFIQAAFENGSTFKIPITGTSMLPLLIQGKDSVMIKKPSFPLNIGDIPLYRRRDGAFVLHRVVGINEDGSYIMCGDNQVVLEYGITDKNVIGVVCEILKDGKTIDVETDSEYIACKNKFVSNVRTRYPMRRVKNSVKKSLAKLGISI